jgi:alkylation response protein AidB-like acyl-CoA dehydrogenase
MRFELTDDQRDFAASLESLLAASDTVAAARAWNAGDREPGLKLWTRLAEQGVLVLATEATPVEVVIAFEALGRHAVPGPWAASAAYLPVARGAELDGPEDLVEPDRDEHPEAYDLAVLATAAQLLGAGERVLADSVAYVKQRRQFGREIGSYQAIKHKLADAVARVESARSAAYHLVDAAATGSPDLPVALSLAGACCSDAYVRTAGDMVQVHGGIGFTWEHDAHLYFKRAKASAHLFGDPVHHRERLAAALLPT